MCIILLLYFFRRKKYFMIKSACCTSFNTRAAIIATISLMSTVELKLPKYLPSNSQRKWIFRHRANQHRCIAVLTSLPCQRHASRQATMLLANTADLADQLSELNPISPRARLTQCMVSTSRIDKHASANIRRSILRRIIFCTQNKIIFCKKF